MKKYISRCCVSLLIILCFISGCSKKTNTQNVSDTPISVENDNTSVPTDDFWNSGSDMIEVVREESEVPEDDEKIADSESYEELEPSADNSDKRVVCWGDSLTVGTGGEGTTMPDTIAKLSGATVLNYGSYGESSSCIAARQGGNPQKLVEDIIIPSDCTPVKAQCEGNYGYEMLLVFGDAGINNAVIGGIEGTYSMVDDERCFTRLTPGEETLIPSGTQLITHAMSDKRSDDILVIWAGSNDGIETEENVPSLAKKIDEMIAYQQCEKYVVVSLTSRHSRIPLVDKINDNLENHYGEHYLDLRSYMVDNALDQLDITPTDYDKKAIEVRDVPYSLRMSLDEEENHGNAHFYRIAGEQIYKKMQELGYLY